MLTLFGADLTDMYDNPHPTDSAAVRELRREVYRLKDLEHTAKLRAESLVDGPEKREAETEHMLSWWDLEAARRRVFRERAEMTEEDDREATRMSEISFVTGG
jgi:hypothetical protein